MSQAGHAKKVIWGLAAAAVVVLASGSSTGTPDVGGPAAGTVGVAKRYAAPQIADEDVKLEASAQTIQAFLDSEAFGRVMADPEAVALLGDPKVRSAIGARAANSDATPARSTTPRSPRLSTIRHSSCSSPTRRSKRAGTTLQRRRRR